MTPLRWTGLAVAVLLLVAVILRRRSLRNVDVLMLGALAFALGVIATTDVADSILGFFDFQKGGGQRILGLLVFASFVLFLLVLRALSQASATDRELAALLEGLALEELRKQGTDPLHGRLAVVIPAYNEADNIGAVLAQMPAEVCGLPVTVLVVDDGSRDGTAEIARAHGAVVARHVINRGGGAALRTGYRVATEAGAEIIAVVDADGQHRPEELPRLVEPIVEGEADLTNGSRVLGAAHSSGLARDTGIVVFNRVISVLTRTKVTDCSNGFRAVRAPVVRQFVFRQDQFHVPEFLIEAIKRGVPTKEVPVTVEPRLSGHSKKPAVFRYGFGFANAIMRTWLR